MKGLLDTSVTSTPGILSNKVATVPPAYPPKTTTFFRSAIFNRICEHSFLDNEQCIKSSYFCGNSEKGFLFLAISVGFWIADATIVELPIKSFVLFCENENEREETPSNECVVVMNNEIERITSFIDEKYGQQQTRFSLLWGLERQQRMFPRTA